MDSPSDNEPRSGDTGQPDPMTRTPDQLYGAYLNHRRYLIDAEGEAAKTFDRWLLTLSGGALGLSMAFARDIAFPAGAVGRWWLLAAWILLAVALMLGLVCILVSQKAHEDSRKKLDETAEEFAKKGTEAGFWAEVCRKQNRLWSPPAVAWLNRCSILAFIAGIVLLSIFASKNLPDQESNNGRKVDSTAAVRQVTPQSARASRTRPPHGTVQRSTRDGAGPSDEAGAGAG